MVGRMSPAVIRGVWAWIAWTPLILSVNCTIAGETVVRDLTVDDLPRSYRLFRPTSVDPDVPAPLVLACHPFATNAESFQRLIQLDSLAEREGFIVAYPNGTGATRFQLTFNAGGVLPPFDADLPDDVEFTRRMIDDVAELSAVDPRRVYATGYSNGGMMAYRLAGELSDRIAAIAAIAGTQTIEFPVPPRPVPILHFHGTQDGVVPTDGPAPGTPPFLTFLTLDETIAYWTARNGCVAAPVTTLLPNTARDGTTVERVTYAGCDQGTEFVLYRILNGGHTWPGTKLPNLPLVGRTTRDISANELLWEFFARHPRP